MKIKKIINLTIIVLCLCLVTGVGVLIYNAQSSYNISRDFVRVPLHFNSDDSTSTYQISNAQVTVYGGFMKGLQKGKDGTESLVIRTLSPLPKVTVKGDNYAAISLFIENINPNFYAKSIAGSNLSMTKVAITIFVAMGVTHIPCYMDQKSELYKQS